MTHYEINYADLAGEAKANKAMDDIKAFIGSDRWEKLVTLAPASSVGEVRFCMEVLMGVSGYPVDAFIKRYCQKEFMVVTDGEAPKIVYTGKTIPGEFQGRVDVLIFVVDKVDDVITWKDGEDSPVWTAKYSSFETLDELVKAYQDWYIVEFG